MMKTRFAPSPTGHLHLGHAYSALKAYETAQNAGGQFILRMEDIDQGRCHPEFEDAIYEDLRWLGLDWEQPVRRQSDHMDDYKTALDQLDGQGLLYPCFCTRKDIQGEINAAFGAPHLAPTGPDGPIYPGTCRHLSTSQRREKIEAGAPFALRLDMQNALKGRALTWTDQDQGEIRATPEIFGDVVLARKDTPTSYHLSVTVDDDLQGITHVVRGEDLFSATHIHRLLQDLLDLHTPVFQHHGLLKAADGRRLAKRDRAETLKSMRENGLTSDQVHARLAGI
ncbi:tRNA glutamyl-Q(34) synthetase GluQRS [Magnetovibrio sp. PR-2]|uniref:tRNA glutamyl-Q(34) synthetase GluQRS n=1 Tax=Magnetovibrio sp. PR-2 TaxID=3120356 RepID=UPI002FCE1430